MMRRRYAVQKQLRTGEWWENSYRYEDASAAVRTADSILRWNDYKDVKCVEDVVPIDY